MHARDTTDARRGEERPTPLSEMKSLLPANRSDELGQQQVLHQALQLRHQGG